MLYSILTRIFGPINLYSFLVWHSHARKLGHIIGYGILCLLVFRGWRATLARTSSWNLRCMSLAWAGTALVACLDEWHQSFIPSRTGTIRDVILDSVAGLMFLVIAQWRLRNTSSLSANTH